MSKSRIDYIKEVADLIEKEENGELDSQTCKLLIENLQREMKQRKAAGDLR